MSKSLNHWQVSDEVNYETPDIETEFLQFLDDMFEGRISEEDLKKMAPLI